MLTIGEALKESQARLKQSGIEGAEQTAQCVLEKVLAQPKMGWLVERARLMNETQEKIFWSLIERRLQHDPLQYIVEEAPFLDWMFHVSPDCLIPRPETEQLALKVADILQHSFGGQRISILDIGTGSGNLAVSLARLLSDAQVTATDISPLALCVAKRNAKKLDVESRVHFSHGAFFENIVGKFDCIVSNPPYLSEAEWGEVSEEVRREPRQALVAGPTGLECYERIITDAPQFLKEKGRIAFEIGMTQAEAVKNLLEKNNFVNVEIKKDFAGLDRIVIASLRSQ